MRNCTLVQPEANTTIDARETRATHFMGRDSTAPSAFGFRALAFAAVVESFDHVVKQGRDFSVRAGTYTFDGVRTLRDDVTMPHAISAGRRRGLRNRFELERQLHRDLRLHLKDSARAGNDPCGRAIAHQRRRP